jgi:phosphohistidine phosphatase
MKRISLIRHAKSDWGDEDLEDIDRPLTSRGYKDAKTMAGKVREAGIVPDLIFSSTAIRASTTALIFARMLNMEAHQMVFSPLLYEASLGTFIKALRMLPEEREHVFVFGHNNTITEVANELTKQSIGPTCGIVSMEADLSSWKKLVSARFLSFDYPKNIPGL